MNDATTLSLPRLEGYHEPMEDDHSLRGTAQAMKRHAPLAITVFVLVLLAGIAYAVLTPPVYRADMLIQIEDRRPTTLDPSGLAGIAGYTPNTNPNAASMLQGELDILKSRELLLKVIDQTHADLHIDVTSYVPWVGPWLARRYAAAHATEAGHVPLAPAPFGLSSYAWGGENLVLTRFDVPAAAYGREFKLVVTDEAAWSLLDDRGEALANGNLNQPVEFKMEGGTGRIDVNTIVGRPGLEFTIRRDSPLMIYEDFAEKLKVAETTRQSGIIRISYESSDRPFAIGLIDRIGKLYVDRSGEMRTMDAERSLRFLEQQIPVVLANLTSAEEKLSAYRTKSSSVDFENESKTNYDRISQLERQRIDLEVRRNQLEQRFERSHPEIIALNRQIATLESSVSKLSGHVNTMPTNQREVGRLQRDVQTNSALYTALLNNMQQLRVSRAAMTSNARVVDPARATEKPVRPKPIAIISIAAGIGLILAFLSAVIARAMHATLREPEDIERVTGLPAIVSIPASARQRRLMRTPMMPWLQGVARNRLLTLRAPGEAAVETLRSLYITLALSEGGRQKKSILIASPTGGVGKSFICANLGALMTMPTGNGPQRRVLLIEADLRRPRLQTYFGLAPGAGLAEVATSDVTFDQVVKRNVLPNLDVLLPGKTSGNPADALMSPRMRELLATLELQYDFILIDSAPVLPVGDALAIAPFAMATYLVAQADRTTPRQLREAIRRLQGVGANVEGVLFNGVQPAQLASRYGGAYALEYS